MSFDSPITKSKRTRPMPTTETRAQISRRRLGRECPPRSRTRCARRRARSGREVEQRDREGDQPQHEEEALRALLRRRRDPLNDADRARRSGHVRRLLARRARRRCPGRATSARATRPPPAAAGARRRGRSRVDTRPRRGAPTPAASRRRRCGRRRWSAVPCRTLDQPRDVPWLDPLALDRHDAVAGPKAHRRGGRRSVTCSTVVVAFPRTS